MQRVCPGREVANHRFGRHGSGLYPLRGENTDTPPDAPEVIPSITLAPVVGWSGDGYRLGYGGGYFDRTLAVLTPRPFTIAIGYDAARLATIFPQPHDIAMDLVITEAGAKYERP